MVYNCDGCGEEVYTYFRMRKLLLCQECVDFISTSDASPTWKENNELKND